MNNSYHILTEQIEAALKQYLEIPDCPQKTVYQAMYEAVNAGGKRLRPSSALPPAKSAAARLSKPSPLPAPWR